MAEVELYAYLDYRSFLKDWLAERAGRPSLRTLAGRLGCSPALLSGIVNGHRDLDDARGEGLCRALELDQQRRHYFLDLVVVEQSTSRGLRRAALERVLATRNFHGARRIEESAWRLFSRWSYPAVAELARCQGFRADPAWVAATLRPQISVEEAAGALATLQELGLLVQDAAGQWGPGSSALVTEHHVDQRIIALALRELHQEMILRAARSLVRDPADERQFGVVTTAVPRALVEDLKTMVARFLEEVMQRCEQATEDRDVVYQLNVQLFPLSEQTANLPE